MKIKPTLHERSEWLRLSIDAAIHKREIISNIFLIYSKADEINSWEFDGLQEAYRYWLTEGFKGVTKYED